MNLFIIHQFPDLDNLAPIIKTLSTKKKVLILSIYPVYDFKKYKILRFLLKHNIPYQSILSISPVYKLFDILLKILFLLPNFISYRLNFLWRYIYYNNFIFNKNTFDNLNSKKHINTINIDDALPKKYKKIISLYAKEKKIPLFLFKNGVEMKRYNKNEFEYFVECDKIIIQDNHHQIDQNNLAHQKIIKSCHRYSKQWLDRAEDAYDIKIKDFRSLKSENSRKTRVVIFTTNSARDRWDEIYTLINDIENIDVKLVKKPRGILKPLHLQENNNIKFTSSELINWADIIVSHASSILIEAAIKNKKILFLEHLSLSDEDLIVNDYNFFEKIYSDNQLAASIQNFKFEKQNDFLNKEYFLSSVLGKNYANNNYLENLIDKLYN